MSFEHLTIYEDEDVDLSLDYAQCWGVERCKNYDGYSIPVRVDDERVLSKLKLMSSKYKTELPYYGRGVVKTIYLRADELSPKQKEELLDKGRARVDVDFHPIGVSSTDGGKRYLRFKVTMLKMVGYEVVNLRQKYHPCDSR